MLLVNQTGTGLDLVWELLAWACDHCFQCEHSKLLWMVIKGLFVPVGGSVGGSGGLGLSHRRIQALVRRFGISFVLLG